MYTLVSFLWMRHCSLGLDWPSHRKRVGRPCAFDNKVLYTTSTVDYEQKSDGKSQTE